MPQSNKMIKEYLKTKKPSVVADPKEPFPVFGTAKRTNNSIDGGDKMWTHSTKKGK